MIVESFLFVEHSEEGGNIVRAHASTLIARMVRAGLRVTQCRYRVVAAGIDRKNRIISIATNAPRYRTRGLHAEERILYTSPKSLDRIVLIRVGARGDLLPIHPCRLCSKQARKRGVSITPFITVESSSHGY